MCSQRAHDRYVWDRPASSPGRRSPDTTAVGYRTTYVRRSCKCRRSFKSNDCGKRPFVGRLEAFLPIYNLVNTSAFWKRLWHQLQGCRLCASDLLRVERSRGAKTGLLQCAFASLVLCTTTAWLFPSLLNPFYAGTALSQYKDVLTTFAGCLFVRLFTPRRSDREKFVKLCVYMVAFGCALKFAIIEYTFATGTSTSDILERLSRAFGVKLMSIELGDVGGRLQFPSDNILPICLFVITGLRKRLHFSRLAGVIILRS